MLEIKYDPTHAYNVVYYGRMSDKRQNKRSPDQQFATIEESQKRCGCPWRLIKKYRDDGVSGRLVRKRPGLQLMLRDIESGQLNVDLIVVDTMERLGRAEEIAVIRHRLLTDHGVLVVAADNNFADPTGVVGKAVGMIEQMRSTENTRTSAHNVTRGKKDCVRSHRWPGAVAPFGYKLKAIVDESRNPPKIYHLLEPEPRAAAALLLAFKRAQHSGEGNSRLAKWWNASSDIPDDFKPISAASLGYRMRNEISIGILKWGVLRTGIVNDTHVTELNPDGPEVVLNFCEPIIPLELFNDVKRLREARSAHVLKVRANCSVESTVKLIKPQGRGIALKYMLSGLVRCASCNCAMRAVPSGRQSKAGKRYVYYMCPRRLEGSCDNSRHVDEERLRDCVVSRLRNRLFPSSAQNGETPLWLPGLVMQVQHVLQEGREEEPFRAVAREQELELIERRLVGWSITLGDPSLAAGVREDIVTSYERAKLRKRELEAEADVEIAGRSYLESMLDPDRVLAQLHQLSSVLAGFNPALCNLEISKHIDTVLCHSSGKIEIRGTVLGLFDGAVELLSGSDEARSSGSGSAHAFNSNAVVPRCRGRVYLPNLSAESESMMGNQDTVLDPNRFAGLPDSFFWTESFEIHRTPSWAEENAIEVGRLRAQGFTVDNIAQQLGKTIPTIRKSLRIAQDTDPTLRELPRKMSRRSWHIDHAAEIAALKAQGLSTMELAKRFEKSDTTIRKALIYARQVVSSTPSVSERGKDEHAA